jgi:hypothetical protein
MTIIIKCWTSITTLILIDLEVVKWSLASFSGSVN